MSLYVLRESNKLGKKNELFISIKNINNEYFTIKRYSNKQIITNFSALEICEQFTEFPYKEEYIKNGSIKIVEYDNHIEYKHVVPVNEQKINKDEIKRIFKYIPIYINNSNGFYNEGKIYYKELLIVNKQNRRKSYIYTIPKYKSIIRIVTTNEDEAFNLFNTKSIVDLCKFKIINYKKSSKLFGFSNIKKSILNKIVNAESIHLGITVKNSLTPENVICINIDNKTYKFALDDVKIIYPNINGWKEKSPLKQIKEGVNVKIINNRNMKSIPINEIVKIDSIKKIGITNYASFKYKNNKYYSRFNKLKIISNHEQF